MSTMVPLIIPYEAVIRLSLPPELNFVVIEFCCGQQGPATTNWVSTTKIPCDGLSCVFSLMLARLTDCGFKIEMSFVPACFITEVPT